MYINRRIFDFRSKCLELNFAQEFDGVSNYYEQSAKTSDFNFSNGENVYLESWVNLDSLPSFSTIFATQNTNVNTSNIGFNFFITNAGNLQFLWVDQTNGVQRIISPNSTITTNSWIHVTLKRESGFWQYYKNGVPITTNVSGGVPNSKITNDSCNGGLLVGRRSFLSTFFNYMNGRIAKIIISNNVPSDIEILRRANEPCCIKSDEFQNVKAAYTFQESSGNLIDESSNGIDLNPISPPTYRTQGPC